MTLPLVQLDLPLSIGRFSISGACCPKELQASVANAMPLVCKEERYRRFFRALASLREFGLKQCNREYGCVIVNSLIN